MAGPDDPTIDARMDELERQMRELRDRLAAIERMLVDRRDHPSDQSTVRSKVSYDWQS